MPTDINKRRVAALRKKSGLSQRALAEQVGLSAMRIASIEAGVASCRVDIALKMSEILHTEVELLFPGAVKRLKGRNYEELSFAELTEIDALGLDPDLRDWCVQGVLSGGQDFQWDVSSRDMRRVFRAMQRLDDEKYIVFDSKEDRVLLNLDHVLYAHFLYEQFVPGVVRQSDALETDDDAWYLKVTFAAPHLEPIRFGMDRDTPLRQDLAEAANIFHMAEIEPRDVPFVAHLTDQDGEDALIRMDAVSMLTVPLYIVEPSVDVEYEE